MAYGVTNTSFSGLNSGGGGGFGGLGGASMILQIGGALSSSIGTFYQSKVQKYQLQAQAVTADTNARIAELGAQSALRQGEQEVGAIGLQAGRIKSAQRAIMGAGNIDLGEGSAAEVQASTDLMKEVDQKTAMTNALQQAWGYRMQGTNFQNAALMDNTAASNISPATNAFTSLLGGAGQVANSWYSLNKAGAANGG